MTSLILIGLKRFEKPSYWLPYQSNPVTCVGQLLLRNPCCLVEVLIQAQCKQKYLHLRTGVDIIHIRIVNDKLADVVVILAYCLWITLFGIQCTLLSLDCVYANTGRVPVTGAGQARYTSGV